MKKRVSLIGVIVILLTMSVSVFAGDVPESLIYEDTAKVFLGTVENHTRKDIPSAPYTEIDSIEVVPTEKIKGDVEIGVKQTFTRCYSTIEFKPDVEYLFGWFDNENVYIYEIESREGNQFKLVGSDGANMTKRLEDGLNNGSYEKAEQEGLAKIEQTAQPDSSSTSVIGGADEPTDIVVKSNVNVWLFVGVGALVLLLVIVFIIRKIKK